LTILLAAMVTMVIAGMLYQQIGRANDARRFPPPGRRFKVGTVRLHADQMGEGSPTVVFEAGIAATSLSWRLVQPEIAKITRTLSYDRAGLGWSDTASKSRDVHRVVEELHALLKAAGVSGPRILVAHSYGALVALGYAARYPREVAALVLVDPVAPSEWAHASEGHQKMLRQGIFFARFGGVLAMLGVVRFALSSLSRGGRAMPKFLVRATSGRGGAGLADRMVGQVRKLPPEVWPMIQSHWCDAKCFFAMARYLEGLPQSCAEILHDAATIRVPVTVLSSQGASAVQSADHQSLAKLVDGGRLEVVAGAGHWIQLDRPDAVIRAIRDILKR